MTPCALTFLAVFPLNHQEKSMTAAWCQHSISVYVCVSLFLCVCESECALVPAQTKNNAAPFLGIGLLRWGSAWLVGGMERRVTSPLVLNFSLFSCSGSTLTSFFLIIFLSNCLWLGSDECIFLLQRAKYVCWRSTRTLHTDSVASFYPCTVFGFVCPT